MIIDNNKSRGKVIVPAGEPILEAPPPFTEANASSSSAHTSGGGLAAARYQDAAEPLPPREIDDIPPEFSTWDAQYSRTSRGDIHSHDPHLNEDGEALYRFLLDHLHPPTFQLHCSGSHKEQRVRAVSTVTHDQHSHDRQVHVGHTVMEEVTITDFDFFINLTPLLGTSEMAEIYTLDHHIPAYRGSMYPQVSADRAVADPSLSHNSTTDAGFWDSLRSHMCGKQPAGVRLPDDELGPQSQSLKNRAPVWRRATRKERKAEKLFAKWLEDSGLPPWTPISGMPSAPEAIERLAPLPLGPQMSVREWADDYCHSAKILKDFNFRKVVYGWDFATLKISIEDLIRSTNYTGDVSISFETRGSDISIRPNTRLSRALSNTWLVVLMWLFLVYPFIWLFRRYSRQGGGRWEVCRAAYALKRPPVSRPDGSQLTEGMKEGDWFHLWQSTIVHSVRARVQNSHPLPNRGNPAEMLDGY